MPNYITGQARTLTGKGPVRYAISKEGNNLYLEITDYVGDANTSRPAVSLVELLDCIVKVSEGQGVFMSDDLEDVRRLHRESDGLLHLDGERLGTNSNDPAFMVAILKDIHFVEDAATDRFRLRRG